MMRVPNGSLARSGKPRREHGRHIFAYCNVNTNQVLYSFTQVLKGNTALKQLPDAGANNNPAKLRKDLWRPLWSVTLPDGQNGLEQGLYAHEMLREYRKLHELSWKPPPELSRHTTKEEMEEIQKYLDERGGSKTETVHDIIKRRKKKLRQRMVMDQKANSIADLAAVLSQQEKDGVQLAADQETMRKQERNKEVLKMLELATEANRGRLEQIDTKLEALQARRQAKKEGESVEESNKRMARSIMALEKQRRQMKLAVDAVHAAEQGSRLQTKEEKEAQARDDSVRLKVDFLKQLIQERRQAEAEKDQELPVTTGGTLDADRSVAEEQIMDELAPGDAAPKISSQDETSHFKLSDRMLLLELEMIRRQHDRPAQVSQALASYTARQADINELRELARHWRIMFRLALSRHERNLDKWRTLQAAVEGGEDSFTKYMEASGLDANTPTGEPKYESYRARTPGVKVRMRAVEEAIPLLKDLVQMTDGKVTVEDAEATIAEHKSAHPSDTREFTLTQRERRRGSELKVIGSGRAYATVLAKAKIEARADELERELSEAQLAQNDGAEPAGEQESGEEQLGGEGAEMEVEAATTPTYKEVNEAARQVRRLSARIHDTETVAALQASEAQSPDNAKVRQEVEAKWRELDASLQSRSVRVSLPELKAQAPVLLPVLRRAKDLIKQPNGIERLHEAADAFRERSVAAKQAGNQEVAGQQKLKAVMFETVASLREYEDVVLAAPEPEPETTSEEALQKEEAEKEESLLQESESQKDVSQDGESAAKDQAVEEKRDVYAERRDYIQRIRQAQAFEDKAAEAAKAGEERPTPPEQSSPPVDYHALLPSFPEKTTLPKHNNKKIKFLRRPIFTAEGVVVRWNNMLDAEYADSWPEAVVHEPMGLSRHTAPKTTEEPIFDVAEFKNQEGGGYKGKKWAREGEKMMVREQVKGVTESVLEAVVKREAEEQARLDARRAEKRRIAKQQQEGEQRRAQVADPFGEQQLVQERGEQDNGQEKPLET